ncbi:MAG: hypothetical protein ACRD6W_11635, partial [Nitrososphaerales archaeon]
MSVTLGSMDRAETVRAALRQQVSTRRRYEEAKVRELAPEESPEERTAELEELRVAAESADAEMARLRPDKPDAARSGREAYT